MNYFKKVILGLVERPSVAPDYGDSLEMLKQDVCKHDQEHKLLTAQQHYCTRFLLFLMPAAGILFSLYCK